MELRQLEYFEAVYRHRNFTKAAEELHVTQPTVTTAIKNLEKELGVLVFDRENGSIRLTPSGEDLLIHTQVILKNVGKIYEKVKNESTYRRQEIQVGIPPISCSMLYPLVLTDFAREHPNIDVHIQDCCNHETIQRLLQDDLDLGFIILPEIPDRSLDTLSLESGRLTVLLSSSHPLAEKENISFSDLANEDILMYEKGTSYIEIRLQNEFEARGIPWNIRHYFSNFSTIYDLVTQNFGIAFSMTTTSPVLQNLSGMVTRPFAEPMEYKIGLAWTKNKYLPTASREFIRFTCERYVVSS